MIELSELLGPARAHELRDSAQLLVDVYQSSGGQEGRDGGAVENPHTTDGGSQFDSLPQQDGLATVACQHRDSSAWREHPDHLVQNRDRLSHMVQAGQAAHHVKRAIIEREAQRICAHVHRTGAAVVANRPFHHWY
jgi:hypothetical protein